MKYLKATDTKKNVNLDVKDKKILRLLSDNARLTDTTISKKVGLSRDAVGYRISNLEKSGVIQGYKVIVDMKRFDYESYHLFLQLSQPSSEAETKLIEKIKKYPFIRAILKFSGKYDLELALIAKNIQEFDTILNKILSDCADSLNDYEILVISKNYVQKVFPKSFLDFVEMDNQKVNNEKARIDSKDQMILKILSGDASQPIYKIAAKIGLSVDAVQYRIKNLMKNGIILKSTIAINYYALDYDIYGLLLNIQNWSEEKEQRLKEILKTDKNIIWAVKAIGKYNLLIYVCADKPEKFHGTLIRLRNSFPKDIRNYETMIAYEEYKYTYFPENLELL